MINYDDINLISDDTYYLDNNDVFIAKKGKNIDLFNLINIAKNKIASAITPNNAVGFCNKNSIICYAPFAWFSASLYVESKPLSLSSYSVA